MIFSSADSATAPLAFLTFITHHLQAAGADQTIASRDAGALQLDVVTGWAFAKRLQRSTILHPQSGREVKQERQERKADPQGGNCLQSKWPGN